MGERAEEQTGTQRTCNGHIKGTNLAVRGEADDVEAERDDPVSKQNGKSPAQRGCDGRPDL